MERTEETISQHYYWPNWSDYIRTRINFCNNFQKKKKQNFNYVKLPAKESEAIPWYILLVDLIGPYKIIIEGHD